MKSEDYDQLEWERTCALSTEDILRICGITPEQLNRPSRPSLSRRSRVRAGRTPKP